MQILKGTNTEKNIILHLEDLKELNGIIITAEKRFKLMNMFLIISSKYYLFCLDSPKI